MTEISRRKLLQSTTMYASAVVLDKIAWAQSQTGVNKKTVISMQPQLYHGWPTLTKRSNGELLLVYSGGRESHVCPFGRVELMRSKDEGKTWSFPRTLIDGPLDDRDSGIVETRLGTLLVTTFTSVGYESILSHAENADLKQQPIWSQEKLRRWQAAHRRVSAVEREVKLGSWMIRSTDGGLSWSEPYRCLVNSPHGPIQFSDGRLLYAGKVFWYGRSGQANGRIGICESTDDGQTWRWLAEIPTREGDSSTNYHELYAIETFNQGLIVHIRNHNRNNEKEILQSESFDGGKTWSIPHAVGVWGLPSHLLRLKDGRLLMSYGHRRPPLGNQARISIDQGFKWSQAITISSDGASSDLGYPSTVELNDGSLLTVWYEVMTADRPSEIPPENRLDRLTALASPSSVAVLRQAHWSLS